MCDFTFRRDRSNSHRTREEKIAKGGAGSDDEGDDGGEEEEEAIEGVSEGANDGRPTSQSETDSPSGSIRKRKGK